MSPAALLEGVFAERDLDVLVAAMADDVVWRGIATEGIEAPVCQSRDAVRGVFHAWLEQGYSGYLDVVAEAGEDVVVQSHVHPPIPGLEDLHHVYTVRAGRIAQMQDYPTREAALAAVGLA